MTKSEKRKRMKACAIAKFIVEKNIKLLGRPWWEVTPAGAMIESQAQAMNATPTELFRADKPEIDKRRWKRHQRKTDNSNSYLVTVNGGQS